ncbi:MAG: type II secretion system protein J [Planctomycetota bacterium]
MSPSRPHSREAGFSVIEILIYLALLPILAIATLSMTSVGRDAHVVGTTHINIDSAVRATLRHIHDDLLVSGKAGEDTNGNNQLDQGEDGNGNGRLDGDWSLTPTSITFNRRLRDGTWSLPVSYTLVDGTIERAVMTDATGKITRAVIVRGVSEFSVKEKDGEIFIALALERKGRKGRVFKKFESFSILMRN